MPSSSELLDYVLMSPTDDKDTSKQLPTYQKQQATHHSDYDLHLLQQQQQTKKSVSFSENIAKHLISPCNPGITFAEDMEREASSDLVLTLHGKETNTLLKTLRYGGSAKQGGSGMRRCQSKNGFFFFRTEPSCNYYLFVLNAFK